MPPKDITRVYNVGVRFSDEELAQLKQDANDSYMTLSSYVRESVRRADLSRVQFVDVSKFASLLPDMETHGQNLNVIAKDLNTHGAETLLASQTRFDEILLSAIESQVELSLELNRAVKAMRLDLESFGLKMNPDYTTGLAHSRNSTAAAGLRQARVRPMRVRMNRGEMDLLRRRLDDAGMKPSAFVRELVMRGPDNPMIVLNVSSLNAHSWELTKQGTNLGQIRERLMGVDADMVAKLDRAIKYEQTIFERLSNLMVTLRYYDSVSKLCLTTTEDAATRAGRRGNRKGRMDEK